MKKAKRIGSEYVLPIARTLFAGWVFFSVMIVCILVFAEFLVLYAERLAGVEVNIVVRWAFRLVPITVLVVMFFGGLMFYDWLAGSFLRKLWSGKYEAEDEAK